MPQVFNPTSQTWSRTEARTFAKPNALELEMTSCLEKAVEKHMESETEKKYRDEILESIRKIVKQWSLDITEERIQCRQEDLDSYCGKVLPFGSVGLHTNLSGSDIDLLVIAPRHVHRLDFFTSFRDILDKKHEVKEMVVVQDIFVPVISVVYDGIHVDFVFARIMKDTLSGDLRLDDVNILKDMDEICVRSINGYRLTEWIRSSIPDLKNFRLAIRAIKLWAKNKQIYSSVLGFLGGTSWTLVLLGIHWLYPHAAASTLVYMFFCIMSKWRWQTQIYLEPIQSTGQPFGFEVWNEKKQYKIAIITPVYPQINSSHQALGSARGIISAEIKKGLREMNRIYEKKDWSHLFVPFPPNRFKLILQMTVSAKVVTDLPAWKGIMQTHMRHILNILHSNLSIRRLSIFREGVVQSEVPSYQWLVGLMLDPRCSIARITPILDLIRSVFYKVPQMDDMYTKRGMTFDIKCHRNYQYLKTGDHMLELP